MIRHLEGDCRQILPTLEAKSVHSCVTSPPYWRLRSYLPGSHSAKSLEIGQERTVREYIENLVGVFREVSRVLMNDGTLWLNLGDAYADRNSAKPAGVKPGELMGLPWRVAMALQADGWYLRSDIIWYKPNPKPEGGIKDRPTKAHEYLFLLTRKLKYRYDIDSIREPITSTGGGACFGKQRISSEGTGAQSRRLKSAAERSHPLGKNKRSVWKIPVRAYPGAHFAVFPKDLVKPCILAGCPKGGTVMDPFGGSGTVGLVAEELGRDSVLIELNPAYVVMQGQREATRSLLETPKTLAEPSIATPVQASAQTEPQRGFLFPME